MDKAPNKLRLVDGQLALAEGGSPAEYLRGFAERMKVTPDTPVCLITKAELDDLLFHRQLMLAA